MLPPPVKKEAALSAVREIDDLPAPPGWPVFGNAFQVDPQRIHALVEAWARRYGPIFRFRLGPRRLLVVTDHEAVGAILRDRPDGFRRNPLVGVLGAEMGLQGGVFNAEGDIWRRQRRMVMAGFDPRHIQVYFDELAKVSGRLAQRWRRAVADDSSIDLQADLMRFTVDAISGLAFGADINTLESDGEVIQQHLDQIFPAFRRRLFALLPTWRWLKTSSDRRLEQSVKVVNQSIAEFVAAARQRLVQSPDRRAAPANLLEALIVAADDVGSAATDAEISGNVMTMLLAGEDTTANTLAWMIYLLKRNPDCLARALEEIDRVVGPVEAWTIERFAELKYVGACANETMRLKPVAPFVVLQSLRNTTVAGVRVPAGELVWLCLRKDSVSENFFPEAQAFKPERWLDGTSHHDAHSPTRVSMPFGAGPRVCPGRHLAMLEMKMALSTLLSNFELASVATVDGGEPEEIFSFTMEPAGLAMKLRGRKASEVRQE
jgi:cytochrome P450